VACAPFAATERFIRRTAKARTTPSAAKTKKAIEVGERGGLLFPQMCESLQRHSPGSNRIAGEFQKTGLGLVKKGQRASPYLSTVFGPDEPMSFWKRGSNLTSFYHRLSGFHRPRPWFRDRNND
jgi:hypothetical protein